MLTLRWLWLITLLSGLSVTAYAAPDLNALITGPHRSDANIKRNQYRHPVQTLQFFGLKPDQAVLEVWPGAGWYTEILAPYLKDSGTYYAAHFSRHQSLPFFQQMREDFLAKLQSRPDLYGNVKLTSLYPPAGEPLPAPSNSLDLVLTFRNVHNWAKGGFDQAMFNDFFTMLKPGGYLGVVEHRAKPGTSFKQMINTGYMTTAYVIHLAQKAGFKLAATSEINANTKDNTDHPDGVWSLPPTLRGAASDEPKMLAIGESDRMTLKFVKPGK